jgi:hypothetical protein
MCQHTHTHYRVQTGRDGSGGGLVWWCDVRGAAPGIGLVDCVPVYGIHCCPSAVCLSQLCRMFLLQSARTCTLPFAFHAKDTH